MTALTAELADFGPRLLIMDPLSGILGGVVDENSSETAYVIVGLLREALPKNCGLVVCCHTAKTDVSTAVSPKGSVGWWNGARQSLTLRPLDDADARTLADDAADVVVFETNKANNGPKGGRIYLRRCMAPEFGGVLRPFDMADHKHQAAQAKMAAIADAVLGALRECPVTIQEAWPKGNADAKERGEAFIVAVNVNAGRDVTRTDRLACLKAMLEEGLLTKVKDGKREVLTPVAPPEMDESYP
jgi:hypothetical protein